MALKKREFTPESRNVDTYVNEFFTHFGSSLETNHDVLASQLEVVSKFDPKLIQNSFTSI